MNEWIATATLAVTVTSRGRAADTLTVSADGRHAEVTIYKTDYLAGKRGDVRINGVRYELDDELYLALLGIFDEADRYPVGATFASTPED